jgi:hypothetical protein
MNSYYGPAYNYYPNNNNAWAGRPRPRSGPAAPLRDETKLLDGIVVQQAGNRAIHVDVLSNSRGKFFRISQEIRRPPYANFNSGPRFSRVIMSPESVSELATLLPDFVTAARDTSNNAIPSGPSYSLKSETLVTTNKRYFVDLKENDRGRLLRISQVNDNRGTRDVILVFAVAAIEQLAGDLDKLLQKHPADPQVLRCLDALPDPRSLKIDSERRTIYFDLDTGRSGIFLRISEVRNGTRHVLTLPEHAWDKLNYIVNTYRTELDTLRANGTLPPAAPAAAKAAPAVDLNDSGKATNAP